MARFSQLGPHSLHSSNSVDVSYICTFLALHSSLLGAHKVAPAGTAGAQLYPGGPRRERVPDLRLRGAGRLLGGGARPRVGRRRLSDLVFHIECVQHPTFDRVGAM